ncbi:NADPH-dependent FMN reductase [Paenibacillus aquistagni]|uniref:NADPH-dependent FMN reductase n=1 Tax=Paenibacillus aquistagni TaxID=1852522 RepID=UPI00145A11D8|nr:NADPH-dependent FMN reductase [Paenibacillus aquistagni]NMM53551.1 NAD(P)H-dependent oxidoreductase [Paenibacillus aquistagni]
MNIAIIAGSNRKQASSTKLSEYVAGVLGKKGGDARVFDLYQQPLPMYCPDDAYDDDRNVAELKELMMKCDGIVLATPEYHSSISGALKNALDHLNKDYFSGKPVLVMSSSGGAVGVSCLQHMQGIVRNLHGINSPEWISIGGAQRQSFEGERAGLEVQEDVDLRIHRACDLFVSLVERLRKG